MNFDLNMNFDLKFMFYHSSIILPIFYIIVTVAILEASFLTNSL